MWPGKQDGQIEGRSYQAGKQSMHFYRNSAGAERLDTKMTGAIIFQEIFRKVAMVSLELSIT
jgi:hypothetical protein